MTEPYTDEEKSLARVLGINVQTARVSKYAQHLDRVFRRKNIPADIKVGKIFCGPNSEPKVEVSFSTDAAAHLGALLDGEEADEAAIQYRKDHDEMLACLKQINDYVRMGQVVPNGKALAIIDIREILEKNGCLDG